MLLAPSLSALAGAVTMLAMAVTAPAADDPLAAYRWRSRVLLVSAADAASPAVERQRALFRAMGGQAAARDLVLVEALGEGSGARALRRAAAIDDGAFRAVLIGKDGGAKLRSARPLGPDTLFPTIDAMPMRQDEMRRQQP